MIFNFDPSKFVNMLENGKVKSHELEKFMSIDEAMIVRQRFYGMRQLTISGQDCNKNCENLCAFLQIPIGIAPNLIVNNRSYNLPLATTEAALVASISRGCKVIREAGGLHANCEDVGMTRSCILETSSLSETLSLKRWIQTNERRIRDAFEMVSDHMELISTEIKECGKLLFVCFRALTGSAMGMNMVTRGATNAILFITENVTYASFVSVSGNLCVDKKQNAKNWLSGRGKHVSADIKISADVVKRHLKCSVDQIVHAHTCKCLIGSALAAGGPGSQNAQASNVISAIFAATGQDLGQVITSSICLTTAEACKDGSLHFSCLIPSLEVGVIGGGTALPMQHECLRMLLGEELNVKEFACIVAGAVMAGELSLLAALVTNDLARSHDKLSGREN